MSKITITNIHEVKAGDKVTFRTRETDAQVGGEIFTATAKMYLDDAHVLEWPVDDSSIEFISAEREVALPTKPGYYLDSKSRQVCITPDNGWFDGDGKPIKEEHREGHTPLTFKRKFRIHKPVIYGRATTISAQRATVEDSEVYAAEVREAKKKLAKYLK